MRIMRYQRVSKRLPTSSCRRQGALLAAGDLVPCCVPGPPLTQPPAWLVAGPECALHTFAVQPASGRAQFILPLDNQRTVS